MIRRFAVCAAFLSLLIGGAVRADDAAQKAFMEQIGPSYMQFYGKQDAAGLFGLWAPGGVFVTVANGPVKMTQAAYEGMFKGGMNHLESSATNVIELGPDTMAVTGSFKVTGKNPSSGAEIISEGYFATTYVKLDGKWKIKILAAMPKATPAK
jgi:ketosteroid isomerase-like protein